MTALTTSLAEELEGGEEQLDIDAVWGERAQQLVDYVKGQKPPIAKLASIHVFAMRKGWEKLTLGGILKYCVEKKLLAGYNAVSGAAFKIPMTPVFDQADGDVEPKPSAVEPPACLCARTAPAVNYGCPTHGGTRLSTPKYQHKPKEKTMAKEMITTADAAELLDMTTSGVRQVVKRGELEAHPEGDGARSPLFFKRGEVLALIEKRKGDMLNEPKAKPTKKKATALVKAEPQTMRRTSKPEGGGQPIVSKLADEIGALREDVITLVRVVDRGWMSQDEAFAKLREISESL